MEDKGNKADLETDLAVASALNRAPKRRRSATTSMISDRGTRRRSSRKAMLSGEGDQRSRARASDSGLEVLILDVEFESLVVAPRLGVLVDVEVKLGLWRTPCRCTARPLGRQAEVAQDLLRDGWIVDGASRLSPFGLATRQ
jgi:hypothetical protein